MLGDNIIYNLEDDFSDLKLYLLANQDKKVSIAVFENISPKYFGTIKRIQKH